ncbi:SET domain-containing protein-lysine N-methyltransferase [Niabella ginsenosidivorans]|uniref:SET domain-containing protein-lysine N-methyltransferase n=1 Tax=Niabella ginsenosidivorans TaxID=1176587 RepID=A0A1A9I8G8_9BACT|nr:SET domain-containing protein-lysine N-methyltransferase [Niabella ginsenosidivorans]ANH82971.1 SET domain-containing protein-lysine N-methyltransferase [Niabella ginsenosidivorans]
MPSSKRLFVKTSTLPNAGKGLFTKVNIAKNEIITEYIGNLVTWKEVEQDVDNGYIFHINDDAVIDASKNKNSFGRYANDAAGLQRVKGITNNAEYMEEGTRVFIKAKRAIPAGSEIFVAYGPQYWKQVRENIKLDAREQKKKSKKAL